VILDFEDELSRKNNFKLLFPNPNFLMYKSWFEEDRPMNFLLSFKFLKGGKAKRTSTSIGMKRCSSPVFIDHNYLNNDKKDLNNKKDKMNKKNDFDSNNIDFKKKENSEESTVAEEEDNTCENDV